MPQPPDRLIRLAVDGVSIDVDVARGARAVSWQVDGHELLGGLSDAAVEHGMYPMAPWAGRLRGNVVRWAGREHALAVSYAGWAIHGTVLDRAATVIEHRQDAQEARLLARIDGAEDWPWPMAVDIEWTLRPTALATRISVHALAEPFPAVVGWHPWFRRHVEGGGALEWSTDASVRVVRGDDHLPTDELVPFAMADGPFDDAFMATSATVRWPGLLTIDVLGDGGWIVVFDERDDHVCIEPQSGPPDGLREAYGRAVPVASPGDPVTLGTTWVMRREQPGDRA